MRRLALFASIALLISCGDPAASGTTSGQGGATGSGGATPSGGANSGGSTFGGSAAAAGGSSNGGSSNGGSSNGGSSNGGSSNGGSSNGGSSNGGSSNGGSSNGGATAGTTSGGTTSGGTVASGGTTSTTSGGATSTTSGGTVASSGGSASGGAATGGSSGDVTLSQTGNPIYDQLNNYKKWLSTAATVDAKLTADKTLADNIITWQLPHGGWYKNGVAAYAAPWNGTAARSGWTGANGVELGTIDNQATVTEIMFLADVYKRSSVTKYRDSARKGLDYLLTMQYASGGFPQVYPARPGTYSNYVTFNDDAMARVMILLDQAAKLKPPLDGDVFTADERAKLPGAIAKGIDYILKSQIVQSGVKTVWCAQHDPTSYAPMGARSYELPSKSGSESVGVITFLLTQPQSAAIKASAQAAIAWFKSSKVKVADTAYVSRPSGSTDDTYNPIQAKAGSTMWYRFYDLAQDVGFFSGRLPTDDPPGVGKKYNIMEIEAERRYGYQWGGAYGTKLFAYTDTVGY
ncbi:MAG: pectate lyase [Polyangiaceae bacterium]